MRSHDPAVAEQQQLRARALELGNAGESRGADELIAMLKSQFPEVRRLAASALGKLAKSNVNDGLVVYSLAAVAENDDHPQVRQYALKSIAKYPRIIKKSRLLGKRLLRYSQSGLILILSFCDVVWQSDQNGYLGFQAA